MGKLTRAARIFWRATHRVCGWRASRSCWWNGCAWGCHGTDLARETVGTLRLKLLKVAARVTVSVRRVYLQLSSAYPRPDLFRLCHARLMQLTPADG